MDVLTQPQKIDYVLTKGCEYLGLDKESLSISYTRSGSKWEKKRYLAPILYRHTVATYNEIAKLLGYKSHRSVVLHIQQVDDELTDRVYGSPKTKAIYKELLAYLNLTENK